MKISYILPSLVNKGPIIVVQHLVKELLKQGHDITVFYFDDIKGARFDCPTIKLENKSSIKFDDFDIVHSHMYRPDRLLSKRGRGPYHSKFVSTMHADIQQDLLYSYNKIVSIIFTPIWLKFLRKMDAVITISEFLNTKYQQKLPNLITVYNGVNIDSPAPGENCITDTVKSLKEKGFTVIVSYAFLSPRKGLSQVLKILPFKSNYVMIIIGDGPDKKNLQKLAASLNIEDRVYFFPYVQDPYKYLSETDLYVMPSYSEGFGLALVEAVLSKIPVVCSDIPVFKELFDNDEVTFFELDNENSLSNSITSALENASSKVVKAYQKAERYYTVTAMTNKYLKIYNKLLEK